MPSLRNHLKDSRWISTRLGTSRTAGIFAKLTRLRLPYLATLTSPRPFTVRTPICDGAAGGGAWKTATGVRSAFVSSRIVRMILGRLRAPAAAPAPGAHWSRARAGSLAVRRTAPGFARAPFFPATVLALPLGDAGLAFLDVDRRADLGQLSLDRLGFLLGDLLLDRLGGAVDQVLGLLQTEPGQFAHHLDHLDLLVADRFEDGIELRLLLDGRRARSTPTRSRPAAGRGHHHGSGGADAELLFERLHQLGQVNRGQGADLIDNLVYRRLRCHRSSLQPLFAVCLTLVRSPPQGATSYSPTLPWPFLSVSPFPPRAACACAAVVTTSPY